MIKLNYDTIKDIYKMVLKFEYKIEKSDNKLILSYPHVFNGLEFTYDGERWYWGELEVDADFVRGAVAREMFIRQMRRKYDQT